MLAKHGPCTVGDHQDKILAGVSSVQKYRPTRELAWAFPDDNANSTRATSYSREVMPNDALVLGRFDYSIILIMIGDRSCFLSRHG